MFDLLRSAFRSGGGSHEGTGKQPDAGEQHEAIDVSDFVYAATGARVRRLTMPEGVHRFPAVDVCKEFGHTNSRQALALADHVPKEHREILETVTGAYGLSIPQVESGAETCAAEDGAPVYVLNRARRGDRSRRRPVLKKTGSEEDRF